MPKNSSAPAEFLSNPAPRFPNDWEDMKFFKQLSNKDLRFFFQVVSSHWHGGCFPLSHTTKTRGGGEEAGNRPTSPFRPKAAQTSPNRPIAQTPSLLPTSLPSPQSPTPAHSPFRPFSPNTVRRESLGLPARESRRIVFSARASAHCGSVSRSRGGSASTGNGSDQAFPTSRDWLMRQTCPNEHVCVQCTERGASE